MKYFATEKIGAKRKLTPEGFLIIEEVPLARTGTMLYRDGEVPVDPGTDGVIRVDREDKEVFSESALASFNGKPLVNDHPSEDVSPTNWRALACGTVMNARRGGPGQDDLMLGDILVTDQAAIDAILDGKVELSCGYDAQYETVRPGYGRQYDIIGNHVALVDHGRCGPRCAIGDQAMPTTKAKRATIMDRLKAAFGTRDAKAFDAEVENIEEELNTKDESGLQLHIHNGPAGETTTSAGDDGSEESKQPSKDDEPPEWFQEHKKATDESMAAITKSLGDMGTLLASLKQPAGTGDADEPEDKDKDKVKDAEDPDKKDEDDKTKDSATFSTEFTETLARAEILSPGIKAPTYDAKAKAGVTRDAMCALRRNALAKGYTGDAKDSIDTMLVGKTIGALDNMTCDAVSVLFTGAAELQKATNNGKMTMHRINTKDKNAGAITQQIKTPADFNAAMRKKYGQPSR